MFARRDVGRLFHLGKRLKAGWKINGMRSWKKAEWIVSSTHLVLLCFSPFFLVQGVCTCVFYHLER